MRVDYGSTTLFDHADADGSALFGMAGSIGRAVDISSPILADEITTYFRNTKRTELRFSVSRPAADQDTAVSDWFTHDAELAGDQDLVITSGSVVVTIAGNLMQLGLPQRVGKRVVFDYQFTGGRPTVTSGGETVSASPFTAQTIAPSATGSTSVSLAATQRWSSLLVQPTAGTGSYTHKIVLPTTNRLNGDVVNARLEMPASTNPSIEFRNASTSGTLLGPSGAAIAGLAGAAVYELQFVFSGSAWRLQAYRNES